MGPLILLLGAGALGGVAWLAKRGVSSGPVAPAADGTVEVYVSAIIPVVGWPADGKQAILTATQVTPKDGDNALTYPNRLGAKISGGFDAKLSLINMGPFKLPASTPVGLEQEALLKVANIRVGLTDQGARPMCVYAYDKNYRILAYEGLTRQGVRWIYGFPSRASGSKWFQDSAVLEAAT